MRYLLVLWLLTGMVSLTVSATETDFDQLQQKIAAARKAGEPEQAERLAQSYFDIAFAQENQQEQARALYEMANNAMERNNYPSAKQHLEQAISLLQHTNAAKLQANVLRRLGMVYRYQSDYAGALKYVYQAMQRYQALDDKPAIAATYSNIGVILEKMGQYETALQAHQQSLNLFQQLNDTDHIASAIYNLGDLFRVLGDNTQALAYFQQSLQLDTQRGDKRDIAYSHNKLGYLYADIGELDKATVHANQAITLFQQIGAARDTEWARTVVAKVAMEQGDFANARQLLDSVIATAKAADYKSLLVDSYRMAAELALKQQQDELALSYLEPGIALAQQIKEQAKEAILQKMQVEVYIRQDRVREALNALLKQKQLEDDIFSGKRAATIAAIQAQTDYTLQQNQLELLRNKQQLQQAQLEQQKLARNFWILGLCASFVLLISLYRRVMQRRHNSYLEQEVNARTAELKQKNIELERAYEQLEAISLTDKLTGLHNRRFLESHIEADLEQYRRIMQSWQSGKTARPDNAELALFIIDLDHFKALNDTYGHDVGDMVLKQMRGLLQQVFRQSDYLVRWGGEEFVVVARDVNRAELPLLAQRLTNTVQQAEIDITTHTPLRITCSVGYCCYPLPFADSTQHWSLLLKLADICLYAAKNSGRNGWVGLEYIAPEALQHDEAISANDVAHWHAQNLLTLHHSFNHKLSWHSATAEA